jgi:hypothetical protein
MDVEIEEPHVHHRRLGIPWYDLALPIAALLVSFISIYIAWHHGQVMQELVHQNEKIVEAESLPYLQIDTSTLETDLETPALRLTVQNQGVGPARIAEVIMTVNGQPVGDFNTLVDHCCAPGLLQAAHRGTKQFRGIRNGEVILSSLRDRMIRPGEAIDAFDWHITDANHAIVDLLRSGIASNAINVSVCYCSVFDDCWTRTDDDRRPTAMKECPIAKVPYRQ